MNAQVETEIRPNQTWRGHGNAAPERVFVIAVLDGGNKILLERVASRHSSTPLHQIFRVTPWQLRAAYELHTDAPKNTLDRDTAIGLLAIGRAYGTDVSESLREHFAITDDEIADEIQEMARST